MFFSFDLLNRLEEFRNENALDESAFEPELPFDLRAAIIERIDQIESETFNEGIEYMSGSVAFKMQNVQANLLCSDDQTTRPSNSDFVDHINQGKHCSSYSFLFFSACLILYEIV